MEHNEQALGFLTAAKNLFNNANDFEFSNNKIDNLNENIISIIERILNIWESNIEELDK